VRVWLCVCDWRQSDDGLGPSSSCQSQHHLGDGHQYPYSCKSRNGHTTFRPYLGLAVIHSTHSHHYSLIHSDHHSLPHSLTHSLTSFKLFTKNNWHIHPSIHPSIHLSIHHSLAHLVCRCVIEPTRRVTSGAVTQ
jgi:hypothetical protein